MTPSVISYFFEIVRLIKPLFEHTASPALLAHISILLQNFLYLILFKKFQYYSCFKLDFLIFSKLFRMTQIFTSMHVILQRNTVQSKKLHNLNQKRTKFHSFKLFENEKIVRTISNNEKCCSIN